MTEAQLKALARPADPDRRVQDRLHPHRRRRAPTAARDQRRRAAELGQIFDLAVAAGRRRAAVPFGAAGGADVALLPVSHRDRRVRGNGGAAGGFRLTDHEVATLLSYSLLGQPPTAALLAAADRGELTKPATLRTTIDALLATPEAARAAARVPVPVARR